MTCNVGLTWLLLLLSGEGSAESKRALVSPSSSSSWDSRENSREVCSNGENDFKICCCVRKNVLFVKFPIVPVYGEPFALIA